MTNDAEAAPLIEQLRRDGFVVLRGFFSDADAAQAHRELEEWFASDLEERRRAGVGAGIHQGGAGKTVVQAAFHLLVDAFGRSPRLDGMFASALEHPVAARVIRALAGERIKLRGYNVRRMNGRLDPPPGLGWHCDNPGEIGFGILLTDVGEGDAPTSFLAGTRSFPYNPREKALIDADYQGARLFTWLRPFNALLWRRIRHRATAATGKRGDLYIFLNDTWHGRQPNLHGRESMIVLIGAFPAGMPFPDEVALPAPEVLARLPARLAEVLSQDQPPDPSPDTLVQQHLATRAPLAAGSLFWLAHLERRVADALTPLVGPPERLIRRVIESIRLRGPKEALLHALWPARAAAEDGRAAE